MMAVSNPSNQRAEVVTKFVIIEKIDTLIRAVDAKEPKRRQLLGLLGMGGTQARQENVRKEFRARMLALRGRRTSLISLEVSGMNEVFPFWSMEILYAVGIRRDGVG
jgi:hypothetical protein